MDEPSLGSPGMHSATAAPDGVRCVDRYTTNSTNDLCIQRNRSPGYSDAGFLTAQRTTSSVAQPLRVGAVGLPTRRMPEAEGTMAASATADEWRAALERVVPCCVVLKCEHIAACRQLSLQQPCCHVSMQHHACTPAPQGNTNSALRHRGCKQQLCDWCGKQSPCPHAHCLPPPPTSTPHTCSFAARSLMPHHSYL